jgi:hypothetical protein
MVNSHWLQLARTLVIMIEKPFKAIFRDGFSNLSVAIK